MERIRCLAYRFKLFFIIRIYNIILVVYLELVINLALDLYSRSAIILLVIIINNYNKYKIKRLIRKR